MNGEEIRNSEYEGMTDAQSERFELMTRYIQLDAILETLSNPDEIRQIVQKKSAIRRQLQFEA